MNSDSRRFAGCNIGGDSPVHRTADLPAIRRDVEAGEIDVAPAHIAQEER